MELNPQIIDNLHIIEDTSLAEEKRDATKDYPDSQSHRKRQSIWETW